MLRKSAKPMGVMINPTQVKSTTPVRLCVGIDAGSTQTRVCIADIDDVKMLMREGCEVDKLNLLNNNEYIIPSTYAIVPDAREIKAQSPSLEDNYDSQIVLLKNSAVRPMLSRERVIRGRRITDTAGMVSRFMDSSTNKMDNPVFYTNVIDGIGYAVMQKYSGRIPSEVDIHMSLSVRPKERSSQCCEIMDSNFVGKYQFLWKDVDMKINIVETIYTTEPEAQIEGTSSMKFLEASVFDDSDTQNLSEKLAESDSYIHIEGGGSSVGVEIVRDGNLIDACSATFQLGGNYLQRVVRDRIREVRGHNVSEDSVATAVRTCLLKNGRSMEDVSGIVADCKNDVALEICERLHHDSLDLARGLTLRDMEFISLGGRLFSTDEAGNSIAQYFEKYVQQISPNTEVITLKDNYIPQGNVIIMAGVLAESIEDFGEDEEEISAE